MPLKILTIGHRYELPNFDKPENPGQIIQFIEKLPTPVNTGTELRTVNDGTTNEAVLEVLIDRIQYLNSKFSSRENAIVITHLETALLWLEKRTRDRVKRGVEGKAIA